MDIQLRTSSDSSPRPAEHAITGLTVVSFLAALLALAATAAGTELRLAFGYGAPIAFELSPLTCSLLTLIAGLGLVVQSFSSRYCRDVADPVRLRLLLLGAMFAAAATAAAGTLITLAAGWVLTTLSLAALLGQVGAGSPARRTLREARIALLATDLALLGGVAIITSVAGTVELGSFAADGLDSSSVLGIDAGAVAAVLLSVAALGRCAQLPFGAWITQTLTVPTPVSALLHAGIVNAGGLLVIATAPLLTAEPAAVALLVAGAATSLLVGTTRMITRPDVKGALALSTRGQMGFMLLQCALGAFAAAIFHLIAHGMYKAALFLGAGGVVDEARLLRLAPGSGLPAPSGGRALRNAAFAIAMPAFVLVAVVALLAPTLPDEPGGGVLLVFAWATAAQAAWWWLHRIQPAGVGRLLLATAILAGLAAYVGLLAAAKQAFGAYLPAPGDAIAPAWVVVPVLVIAVAATAMHWAGSAGLAMAAPGMWLASLRRRLYARALTSGSWPPRRPASPAGRARFGRGSARPAEVHETRRELGTAS